LLRTKALKSKAGKVTAIISYAKPFPPETPFNLTKAQADVFQKYGEGLKDIEVAETLNISRSALAERRAGIVKKIKKSTGINATNLKKLAIDCLAAGWSAALELNKQIKS
jgi:DNA-binding NarL/FixJ family response regulator